MAETRAATLDTRSDAKLGDFDGKRDKFEQWAFMFESYAYLMGWGILVDAAIREPNPIVGAISAETLRR